MKRWWKRRQCKKRGRHDVIRAWRGRGGVFKCWEWYWCRNCDFDEWRASHAFVVESMTETTVGWKCTECGATKTDAVRTDGGAKIWERVLSDQEIMALYEWEAKV